MGSRTPYQTLLHLRVLALQNIVTGYEPHQDIIARLSRTPIYKLANPGNVDDINHLTRRYRRQITPELVAWKPNLIKFRSRNG